MKINNIGLMPEKFNLTAFKGGKEINLRRGMTPVFDGGYAEWAEKQPVATEPSATNLKFTRPQS